MGELYRRLKAYSETDEYPYHMPGHKRQVCGELPQEIMNIDIAIVTIHASLHMGIAEIVKGHICFFIMSLSLGVS